MHDYLGVEVPERPRWACSRTCTGRSGSLGYFPTYSLGNLISRARSGSGSAPSCPSSRTSSRRASSPPLREWLRENLHRHGRKFTPQSCWSASSAARLDPEPYLAYLSAKLAGIYGEELVA